MQIDIENGKRFNEQPLIKTVSSGEDIVLVRLADGTGVKALPLAVLKNFIAGDLEALDTENKTSLVNAVNEVLGDSQTNAQAITDLEDLASILTYKNAGAHNALYRGKYLGDSLTAAQSATIQAGEFTDLYIGDYWTISGINYRIADFDYFLRSGDTACTQHHAVIVPDSNLYNAQMNTGNVTTGGYAGSAMRNSGLNQAKSTISTAFGSSHILGYREYLCNAVTNGKPSGGAWFDSTIELMTEQMVYGGKVFAPTSDGSTVPQLHTIACKQLNLFRHRPDLISNRQTFWLRDVVSSTYFANVGDRGLAYYAGASFSLGVRPAFPIY